MKNYNDIFLSTCLFATLFSFSAHSMATKKESYVLSALFSQGLPVELIAKIGSNIDLEGAAEQGNLEAVKLGLFACNYTMSTARRKRKREQEYSGFCDAEVSEILGKEGLFAEHEQEVELLKRAMKNGHLSLVRFFIEQVLEPKEVSSLSWLLPDILGSGHTTVYTYLVEKKVMNLGYALTIAASFNQADTINYLLDHVSSREEIDFSDSLPLRNALVAQAVNAFATLVARGANLEPVKQDRRDNARLCAMMNALQEDNKFRS